MTQVLPSVPPPQSGRRQVDVDRPTVAVGVALLFTAVVLSTLYTRFRDHLDWSNYVVGLGATLGLLGIAAAAFLGLIVPRGTDETTDLVAWPGAFGALGTGLMIAVALDDSHASSYVGGLAVVAISAAGYVLVRRAPFVVTAVLGLFVVYGQLVDDIVGLGDDNDIGAIGIAIALTVFAVGVTAAGWPLPTRSVSGVVAGAMTVVGFAILTGVLAIANAFEAAFAPLAASGSGGYADQPGRAGVGRYDNDTWVILVLALLLIVGWAVCAALTRQVGFRILVVAMAVSVTPLATLVLRAAHPTWWGVVVGAVGGALLVAVVARAARRRGPTPPAQPAVPLGGSPWPTSPPPAGPPPSSPPPSSPPPSTPPAGPPV